MDLVCNTQLLGLLLLLIINTNLWRQKSSNTQGQCVSEAYQPTRVANSAGLILYPEFTQHLLTELL